MKKSSIGKIVGITVTLVILLAIVILLRSQPRPATVPAFKFLSGLGSYIRIDRLETRVMRTHFYYSVKTDYHPVIADANSELTALGYVIKSSWMKDPLMIEYYLPGTNPMDGISVRISAEMKMFVFPTPKNSDYKTPTGIAFARNDGWISVEITQRKEMNWITYGCLYLSNKLHRTYE